MVIMYKVLILGLELLYLRKALEVEVDLIRTDSVMPALVLQKVQLEPDRKSVV